MEQVKLLGNWPSIYSYRVVWALELKGVEYQFVNEDLANKSHELVRYNPIYKSIPVLIHNNKPLVESNVVLEYELGMADLAFGWMAWWLEPMEAATGVKLLDPNSFPRLSA